MRTCCALMMFFKNIFEWFKKKEKRKKVVVYSKEQFSIGVLERVAEALMQCLRGYKIDLTVSEDKNNKKNKNKMAVKHGRSYSADSPTLFLRFILHGYASILWNLKCGLGWVVNKAGPTRFTIITPSNSAH